MYEGLVFSNQSLKWVYIFIPRCGSRSFRACGMFEQEDYPHEWKQQYREYKKVAVIRNPIDRLVSGFFYEKGRQWDEEQQMINTFRKYIQPLFEGNSPSRYIANAQVNYLDKLKLDITDLDEILLTESYEENVKSFKDKYDLDIEVLHRNASDKNLSQSLKEYVEKSEDVKTAVLKYYKRDFELYKKAKERVIK